MEWHQVVKLGQAVLRLRERVNSITSDIAALQNLREEKQEEVDKAQVAYETARDDYAANAVREAELGI